jgi:hypothetical protein
VECLFPIPPHALLSRLAAATVSLFCFIVHCCARGATYFSVRARSHARIRIFIGKFRIRVGARVKQAGSVR